MGSRRIALRLVVLLLVAAILAMPTSIMQSRGVFDRVSALFGPEEDGSWLLTRMDGRALTGPEYVLALRGGEVVGGYDDCNSWSFLDERRPGEDRGIHTTLVACPEDDPVRRGYWALTAESAMKSLRPGGELLVSAHGHRARLRRCEWVDERASTPPGTEMRRCRPV